MAAMTVGLSILAWMAPLHHLSEKIASEVEPLDTRYSAVTTSGDELMKPSSA